MKQSGPVPSAQQDGAGILVVDDDPTVSDVVRRYLERAGFRVSLCADGATALDLFARQRPDLVVLDLMLPGMDGLEVCRRLRVRAGEVPIVMLTALGEEADRVVGLQLGADDYLTKPFSPRELVLRVQSVLRRVQRPAPPVAETLIDGDLRVDPARRVATLGAETLALTVREFDLLAYLMRHPGRAFSRADLLEAVWGWTFGDQSTVTVHVRRLREKMEPDPAGRAASSPCGASDTGTRPAMRDLVMTFLIALVGSMAVAVPGTVLLRRLRGRPVTVHVGVLLAVTVLAVLAGVLGAAWEMFISPHDLNVLLIVVAVAGVVSLAVALRVGQRLAAEAMWAGQVRERERQVEASRRELVAWVSHDLRTPLAGLRAMAEALEDGIVYDPVTVADYHRRIRVETDRMAGLVEDLFELSRINAGALRLSLDAVSLGDVVSDVVASAVPVAMALRVRLWAADSGWPTVRGSEPELSRIVANLLRNAIQHTPSDGTVSVTGGRDTAGGWLAVTDSCGGIPEGDLPRVFDVAFRGEAARTPGGGAGLGLAIVRGLAWAHQGDVSVANVRGGCRFTVHLPTA